jgi:hypothetical protein
VCSGSNRINSNGGVVGVAVAVVLVVVVVVVAIVVVLVYVRVLATIGSNSSSKLLCATKN